jgi:hypothetical protein
MSGIAKRTALLCNHKGGIYDSGWRRVTTAVGPCMEPTPFTTHGSNNATADVTYKDQITHVDELDFIPFGNPDVLSGTTASVNGSAKGWWLGGNTQVLYAN